MNLFTLGALFTVNFSVVLLILVAHLRVKRMEGRVPLHSTYTDAIGLRSSLIIVLWITLTLSLLFLLNGGEIII